MTNITKGSNGKYVNSKWGVTFSTCIVVGSRLDVSKNLIVCSEFLPCSAMSSDT